MSKLKRLIPYAGSEKIIYTVAEHKNYIHTSASKAGRRRYTLAQLEEVIRLYDNGNGLSSGQLAIKFEMSEGYVRMLLWRSRNGVPLRGNKPNYRTSRTSCKS